MKKLTVVAILAAVLVLGYEIGVWASNDRRDGNWWQTNKRLERLDYTIGFLDGMDLGHNFSYWKYTEEPKNPEAVRLAITSFNEHIDKYIKHVTVGQLTDGLDKFYDDFRNRSILIANAGWLVLCEIAGEPEKEHTERVENFRKHAGGL